MDIKLSLIENKDLKKFKFDMQEAFQKGYEDEFGRTCFEILPEKDINESLETNDSIAYKAEIDGNLVGGAIIVVDKKLKRAHLDFLYVKCGYQDQEIGKNIWYELELLHPEVEVWETTITYFDKRNIHFYVNICGFNIYSYLNDEEEDGACAGDFCGGMFQLRKVIKR